MGRHIDDLCAPAVLPRWQTLLEINGITAIDAQRFEPFWLQTVSPPSQAV